MRKTKSRGLFDEHFRLEKISKIKDPLEQLNQFIRWEDFRPIIDKAFPVTDPSVGGRPSFDRVMMFKVLVLQRMYNLSDDSTELQILDRLSFCRFLGIGLHDDVPDSKTIWHFREQLKKHDTIHEIFGLFHEKLQKASLLLKDGAIVDASIVETPRQRNTREENKQVREGEIPEDWKENLHKLCQKDIDASWVKKNGMNFFGYKNSVKIDNGSKLIDNYVITSASPHDSEMLEDLLEETDRGLPLWADSAYTGNRCKEVIDSAGMENHIHEKGYRHKKLTDEQRVQNRIKSQIRARVEHVFGFQWMNLDGASLLRFIGFDRCAMAIALRNIIYNFFRAIYLIKTQKLAITL
jgi:IS5 family transposase